MTEHYALLVIGGGPAGFSAAGAYRDAGGDGAVAIIADEERMPYRRPPLTKELLRGEASEADLPLEEESWLDRADVDLIAGRAMLLDADRRRVRCPAGGSSSTGRACSRPAPNPSGSPCPEPTDPRVHVIRTLEHVRRLTARLREAAAAVVVGSGFIGCEIASSLRARGHDVDLISDEPLPNVRRLGEAPARSFASGFRRRRLAAPRPSVDRIEPENHGLAVSRAVSGSWARSW